MSVTGATSAAREVNFHQINRLVSSELLHGSESLCKLLRYLAEQSFERPAAPIKEYQIATEVFGRPGDFDPRLDSTVRVQTGRLRSKLAEFYAGAGSEDKVIVELPKGSYSLLFHTRLVAAQPETPLPLPPIALPPVSPALVLEHPIAPALAPRSALWIAVVTLSLLTAAAVGALIYVEEFQRPQRVAMIAAENTPPVFRQFWNGFLDQPELPWLVFSNAEFVGRPETGMRYFDSAKGDKKEQILDHYTGVGEVLAVHELDRVFGMFHQGMRVKRGRLLSLDDAKNNNLIFVGSPSENLTLRIIPTTLDFVFGQTDIPSRKGDLGIINQHPRPGEDKSYIGSQGMPLTEDYALIALFPGMNPSRLAMTLAGTTTIGTQAAVEFVCRPRNLEKLLGRLGIAKTGIVPFEAVVRIKISGGVPVQSDLVAVHARAN